jgi:hypothetical protein
LRRDEKEDQKGLLTYQFQVGRAIDYMKALDLEGDPEGYDIAFGLLFNPEFRNAAAGPNAPPKVKEVLARAQNLNDIKKGSLAAGYEAKINNLFEDYNKAKDSVSRSNALAALNRTYEGLGAITGERLVASIESFKDNEIGSGFELSEADIFKPDHSNVLVVRNAKTLEIVSSSLPLRAKAKGTPAQVKADTTKNTDKAKAFVTANSARFGKLTPEQRKAELAKVPEQHRDAVRNQLGAMGIPIPD